MTISYHHSLPLHGKPSRGACMLGQDRAVRLSELGVDESPDMITIKVKGEPDEVWYYAGVNDGFAMYARERGEES